MIEHEIMVDRTDNGHSAFCACGYRGRLRIEVEHAFFDANDHRVRALCRRLRRHVAYRDLPAGPDMWPWLLQHRGRIDGELAVIVDLVDEYLRRYLPTRTRRPSVRRHADISAAA